MYIIQDIQYNDIRDMSDKKFGSVRAFCFPNTQQYLSRACSAFGVIPRIAMFLFVLIVIICWNDDAMTIGVTAINKSIDVGKDYLCVQYTCQSNQVCRGCFWMSKCWGEQICIRKWCGDLPFLKDIQVVSNCQDFSGKMLHWKAKLNRNPRKLPSVKSQNMGQH